jgi:O-antigen ligase
MDNRLIVALLIGSAIILSIIAGVAIGSGETLLPAVLVAGLVGVIFIASPRLAAFLAVALYASHLTFPGLPGNIVLSQLLLAAVPALALMLLVFGKISYPRMTKEHLLLIAFCGVVFMTGFIRGFGFRFLGSNLWGGTFYLDIFLGAALVLTLPKIVLPPSWWPVTVITFALMGALPLLAEILVAKTGAYFIQLFVVIGQLNVDAMVNENTGNGVGRLFSAGISANYLLIGFLSVVHTSKLFNVRFTPAIAIALGIVAMSLLSGFRLITATLVLIIFITALFQKTLTLPRMLFGAGAALVILSGIYYISDNLPISAQRAISWLPGINVSGAAIGDADQTIDWRLDVWRAACKSIPEYFWLGKGLAFDGNLLMAAMSGSSDWDPISWALIEGSYHNGYLSLLLGFGIFGFVIGLALMLTVTWRVIALNFAPWKNPRLKLCYQAFLASLTATVIVYLTVYGDVTAVFPPFFFTWACLEAIRTSDENSNGIAKTSDDSEISVEEENAFIE